MRVILNMVIHNEMDRYLQACILHHRPLVDYIFIFDDQSDDLDMGMLKKWGVDTVVRRTDDQPSFIQHESDFRQAGWERMCAASQITGDDWVLGLDADEFFVGVPPRALAQAADIKNMPSIQFHIPEIYRSTPIQERTDGYWGAINGIRMTRWQPGDQSFTGRTMACGVFPAYAGVQYWSDLTQVDSDILHYGYADEGDRQEKFARYSRLEHHHNNDHIKSILTAPTTQFWLGEPPEVWRGIR